MGSTFWWVGFGYFCYCGAYFVYLGVMELVAAEYGLQAPLASPLPINFWVLVGVVFVVGFLDFLSDVWRVWLRQE